MSKQITMTVPDAIYDALAQEGRALEEAPGEVLKSGLMIAFKSEAGWTLKLRAVAPAVDPAQLALPLGGGTSAAA